MDYTNLQKGQTLDSGFVIIDVVDLVEMRSTGIWAKHQKTGVEVFHVLNDDSENLFAFAFATAPEDNTGVAHILEHTVLCGSERYPLKDAFMVLRQGSLSTFLNAWTFPDKTVYPSSSVNEHDYFNLMAVYGDAVFRPLLTEWSFMQEGHRYELVKTDEQTQSLSITGVVFNEMKGAYSSQENYASDWTEKSVLPDTIYALDSGGDPEHIPQLTWEGLKEFHRNRYSPANCRIFLVGNIPTEKQLSFLNDKFFASAEAGQAAPPVEKQPRWNEPKEYRIPCPAGNDTKATVFLSWLCTDTTDMEENIALAVLAEILLGHDGSPLTRLLIESGLGEDISPVSGFAGEMRETLFAAGLRGVDLQKTNAKQIEDLILNELRRLAAEGIPSEEKEAALLFMEFSQKEVRRAGGPFSLVWMRRSLRTWLYGGKPWDGLLLVPAMEKLKWRLAGEKTKSAKSAATGIFESLIQKYFLDNPHRALVVMDPQEDFLPKAEAKFTEKLAEKEKNLSDEEKQRITEKCEALEKFQNQKDSPEALASIPHLSRSDLSPEPVLIPRCFEDLCGIPALCHDLYTNGISYIDLAFTLDGLSFDDYKWLPFFTRASISTGLPGMDYGEVSSLLARTVGGFNSILHSSSPAFPSSEQFSLSNRDWLIYRLKCLDEKARPSLDLALRLISEADFTDERRLRDLILEMKNELRSSIASYGHSYAASRASRKMSPSKKVEEIWSGLTQVEFAHALAETDTAAVAAKLQDLREKIISGGLVANIAGSDKAISAGGILVGEKFGRFGPPRPSNPTRKKMTNDIVPVVEVFAAPLLQVGFAGEALHAAAYDTPAQVSETVLAHRLSTDTLMEEIRMKGGAYGAFASSNGIERCFTLATYRDPDPLRSLDTFDAALKKGVTDFAQEDEWEKMIIGCYSQETRPRSPSEKSFMDMFRYFSRIDDDCRRRRLRRLIDVSAADICAACGELASQKPAGKVIIAGTKYAEKAAEALGVEAQTLPV